MDIRILGNDFIDFNEECHVKLCCVVLYLIGVNTTLILVLDLFTKNYEQLKAIFNLNDIWSISPIILESLFKVSSMYIITQKQIR